MTNSSKSSPGWKKYQKPSQTLRPTFRRPLTCTRKANEVDTELSKIERRIEIVTSRPGESPDGVLTEEYSQSPEF